MLRPSSSRRSLWKKRKKKNALLPSPLLHLVICYGENVLSEFFEKYLELTIKNYLSYKSGVDEQFKLWLGKGLDFPNFTPGGIPPFMSMDSLLELFSRRQKKQTEKE